MGRQIRFYMTDEGEDEFIAFMRSVSDVVILPQTSEDDIGEEYPNFRSLVGRRLGEDSIIWNRSLSPKPSFEHYSVHDGCYCVDFMQSEVVNVMRSKRVDQQLSMGRLHIEDKARQANGGVVEKRREFVTWFNELCRWIKKKYPNTIHGAWLSPQVEALANSGVELTCHSF